MEYSIARKKYSSIKRRNFQSLLDLFLICCYINDKDLNKVTIEHFRSFDLNDTRITEAMRAYQKSKDSVSFMERPISDLDKAIKSWLVEHDIKEYKQHYLVRELISEKDFMEFYGNDKIDRKCNWCDIKESEIQKLIDNGLIKTKRLRTRGKLMEVDRRNPNQGYVKGNMALCCYWCNNAKTDEFNEKEFKPIGELIGKTLKARLNK